MTDVVNRRNNHRHNHEMCDVCRERTIEVAKLKAEIRYLRRQFLHLKGRIEKLLAASVHSGGARKF